MKYKTKKVKDKPVPVPKGAIVGETINEVGKFPDPSPHCVLYFDRPGRVEISVTRRGVLIVHAYDGTKIVETQEPIGGFVLVRGEDVDERWVSTRKGQEGKVDEEWIDTSYGLQRVD